MKLICFSNNTAGGLLCNLLNNNFSRLPGWVPHALDSPESEEFKIGDTPTIQKNIDYDRWNQLVIKNQLIDSWVGTHTHPSVIPNLSDFEKVIAITTIHRNSKLYRWLRYYHGWFKSVTPNWIETNELDKIDKIRCLAKNVFEPFDPVIGYDNVEFEDVVSGKFIKENNLNLEYFEFWKSQNPWLYPVDITSWAVQRFNEAEYEILNNSPFKYI